MSTPGHYLELALDEAERDLYRAARECTDAMRNAPGVSSDEIRARQTLLDAARLFTKIKALAKENAP
jgi:hypothetical protein